MRGWIVCIVVGLLALGCVSAFADTASAYSPAARLKTTSPRVESASTLTENSLAVIFSEPMLSPGVTIPGNYAVSGAGAGALDANPAAVTGGNTDYSLTWPAGEEMRNGQPVTLSTVNLQDTFGNPIDPQHRSTTAPALAPRRRSRT